MRRSYFCRTPRPPVIVRSQVDPRPRQSTMTFQMHICPGNREFMTMCPSVLARPSPCRKFWPDEDPSHPIHMQYYWPGLQAYVKNYCNSCTTCSRAWPVCHRPYRLLKQLPVPKKPLNSVSLDFIEKLLPSSSSYTAILVIVDRMMKQGLFIPTHDMITSQQLVQLFVLHVFSKHGIPSHVTSDQGPEFVSHFRSLGTALDMKLHFTSGYHPEGDRQTE